MNNERIIREQMVRKLKESTDELNARFNQRWEMIQVREKLIFWRLMSLGLLIILVTALTLLK